MKNNEKKEHTERTKPPTTKPPWKDGCRSLRGFPELWYVASFGRGTKDTQHLIDIPIWPKNDVWQYHIITVCLKSRGPPFQSWQHEAFHCRIFWSPYVQMIRWWTFTNLQHHHQEHALSIVVTYGWPPLRCLLATALRDLETLAVGKGNEEQRHVLQQLEATDLPVEKHQTWSISIFFGCCLQ